MSIAELVRRMSEAGAPLEAVALAVEAVEAAKAKDELRRAEQARKKREYRAVHGQSTDSPKTVQAASNPAPPTEPLPSSLLPREEKKEVRSLRSLTVRAQIDADFEAMWKVYPRRPNNPKEPARKAYHKAIAEGATAEEIHRGALLLAAAMAHEEPRYIPHTVTWLNQKRFRDDPTPAPHRPTSTNHALSEACAATIQRIDEFFGEPAEDEGPHAAGRLLAGPVHWQAGRG